MANIIGFTINWIASEPDGEAETLTPDFRPLPSQSLRAVTTLLTDVLEILDGGIIPGSEAICHGLLFVRNVVSSAIDQLESDSL